MGKSILELFQSEQINFLDNGKTETAQDHFAIRNSKDIEMSPNNPLLVPAYKLQKGIRKKTSIRDKETRFEEEAGGLNSLMLLSGPALYGIDLIRLKTKTTDTRDLMVSKANGGGSKGLLSGVLNFAKNVPKKLGSLVGAKFPEQMIPSRFIDETDYKPGSSDLPDQIQKIKKKSEGNGFGRFLQDNLKGTLPDQVGNQVLSSAISEGKKAVEKALFGSRKEGAVNLGKKPENKRYYDAYSHYTDVIDKTNTDIKKRKDLSMTLNAYQTFGKAFGGFTKKIIDVNENRKVLSSLYQRPFLGEDAYDWRTIINYLGEKGPKFKTSKKKGIAEIGKGYESGKNYESIPLNDNGLPISYLQRINVDNDANTPISERNDLSTFLDSYVLRIQNEQPQKRSKYGAGYDDLGVPDSIPGSDPFLYSETDGDPQTKGYDIQRSIQNYREITNTNDTLNRQGVAASKTFTSVIDGTTKTLDEIDFITWKIGSDYSKENVYFRGTIKGMTETFTPAYTSHQSVGMAFPLYTYESIERTIAFSFDVYSLSPYEHIKAWERLQLLSHLTMPSGFQPTGATIPPVIVFSLGDLFHDRNGWIESLSFTTDENRPWEIGFNRDKNIDLSCYKLPMIINVQITLHLIQSSANVTSADRMYDFGNALKRARKKKPPVTAPVQNSQTLPTVNVTATPQKKLVPQMGISYKDIKGTNTAITALKLPTQITAPQLTAINQTPAPVQTVNIPNTPTIPPNPANPADNIVPDNTAKVYTPQEIKGIQDSIEQQDRDRVRKMLDTIDEDMERRKKLPYALSGEVYKASGIGQWTDEKGAYGRAQQDALRNLQDKVSNSTLNVTGKQINKETKYENGVYTVKIDVEYTIVR